jgi:hypothetical protein
MRRGIRGEPDPFEYVQKQAELGKLKQLEDTGKLIYIIQMKLVFV